MKKNSRKKPEKATEKPKEKKRGGRPTKYSEVDLEMVTKLAKLGLIDTEIADVLGIAESTLNLYKLKYPEFSESLKNGKMYADAHLIDRLYQRAYGYEHPEEKIFCHEGDIIRAETTKHYPPSEMALMYWFNNRLPRLWRNKREFEDVTENKPKTIIIKRAKKEEKEDE